MAARCPSGGRTRRANIRRHGRDDESGGRRIGVCPWQPRQAGVDGRPGSAGSGSGPWRCGDRLPRGSTGTRSEVSRGRRRARDSASGRRLRGPGSANGQSKDGCGGSEVKRKRSHGSRREEQETKVTYGGSPFCPRETRITGRYRSRCRILSRPFPRFPYGLLRGRHELPQPFPPKLDLFGFREMGMLNQKRVAVSGDGSRKQFVIDRIDCHGVEWLLTMDNSRGSHCLSVVKCRERKLRMLVYICHRTGTTYVDLGTKGYKK
jgi:hypothetical protein